jgi:hypothetical protein
MGALSRSTLWWGAGSKLLAELPQTILSASRWAGETLPNTLLVHFVVQRKGHFWHLLSCCWNYLVGRLFIMESLAGRYVYV